MPAKTNKGASWSFDSDKKTITGGNGVDIINAGTAVADGGGRIVTGHGWKISGGNGADVITGSEFDDIIWGDSLSNTDSKDNGADTLRGGAGNDEIHGGNGADIIAGDGGADRLYGDRGGDTFKYYLTSDSAGSGGAWSAATGDEIFGFSASEGDKIDLGAVPVIGFDKLTWGSAPDVNGVWSDGSYLYADTSGDGIADLVIKVSGVGVGQVSGVNHDPTAANDSAEVNEDSTVSGNLSTNDSDSDGDTLTYTLTSPAAGLTVNSNGTWSFDAGDSAYQHLAVGATDTVTRTVNVSDGHGGSTSQTLTIVVTGTNDAPTAAATTAEVDEDASTGGSLSAEDVDDGAVLTFSIEGTAPTGFTLDNASTGAWSFDASSYDSLAAGEYHDEVVNFTVTDQHGAASSSTLTITITGVDDLAEIVAGGNTATVTEDAVANIVNGDLDSTDVDSPDDAWQSATIGGSGHYGTLTFGDDGQWSYELDNSNDQVNGLNDGDVLYDSFTVQTADGQDATITITINGHTDAPILPPVIDGLTYESSGDANDETGASGTPVPGAVPFSSLSTSDLNGNNTVVGTSGNDDMDVKNGADVAYGLGGNDHIKGGQDTDTLFGGSGDDYLEGGPQVDKLYGGSGSDVLEGDEGDDLLVGGFGADKLTGKQGNDIFQFLSAGDRGDYIADFNVQGTDKIDVTSLGVHFASGAESHGMWNLGTGTTTVQGVDYSGQVYAADLDGNAATIEFWFVVNTSLAASDFIGLV